MTTVVFRWQYEGVLCVCVCMHCVRMFCDRYLTALRRPQRRSESHFRFDNAYAASRRNLPVDGGFVAPGHRGVGATDTRDTNWTYSHWYSTFGGGGASTAHAGCVHVCVRCVHARVCICATVSVG